MMQPFWPALPVITEDRFRADPAPDCAGLYLLLDQDQVVYVGQSCHIATRIKEHRKEAKKAFSTYKWYPVAEEMSRLILEGILILGLRPRYNRGLNLGMCEGRVWEVKWGRSPRPRAPKKIRRS